MNKILGNKQNFQFNSVILDIKNSTVFNVITKLKIIIVLIENNFIILLLVI